MTIYPLSTEKSITTPDTLSAAYVNVTNTSNTPYTVNILDLNSEVVASFTILANERLIVGKEPSYSLSANNSAIKAVPVIRM